MAHCIMTTNIPPESLYTFAGRKDLRIFPSRVIDITIVKVGCSGEMSPEQRFRKGWDKVKACIMGGYLSKDSEEARKQWLELEKMIADIACANEHQGFIYGFRLAMGLFIGNERPYGKSQFEEHIRSEYSTLMVSDLDRTD
ncbi:MAG: hypothetical protein K2O16_14260 [Lachnospiraceae bacterium]|nr:hypothetical protein [Lachnospiraceae bacterium]